MAIPEDFHVIVGDFNDSFVEIVAETVAEAFDPASGCAFTARRRPTGSWRWPTRGP